MPSPIALLRAPVMEFIYVKIPVTASLSVTEDEIHEALETALANCAAGSVVGWGASLEDGLPGGRRRVAFHRIDIEAATPDAARALILDALNTLEMPPGTELHYTVNGLAMEQVLGPEGWHPPQRNEAASRPGPP